MSKPALLIICCSCALLLPPPSTSGDNKAIRRVRKGADDRRIELSIPHVAAHTVVVLEFDDS